MPKLICDISEFERFGDLVFHDRVGAGETTLEHLFSVRPGRWTAFHLSDEKFDDLVDAGVLPEGSKSQLVLIHEGVEHRSVAPAMTMLCSFPIEGARFTIAAAEMREQLGVDDGFYDHLDGIHGVMKGGNGVHVMLSGDGEAKVWADNQQAELIIVELG